jgi:hypothetical protein
MVLSASAAHTAISSYAALYAAEIMCCTWCFALLRTVVLLLTTVCVHGLVKSKKP